MMRTVARERSLRSGVLGALVLAFVLYSAGDATSLPARAKPRCVGTLSFEHAHVLVESLRKARNIEEPFIKEQTLSILPTPTPPPPTAPGRKLHPLRTLYLHWEGGCLEVAVLVRRAPVQRLKELVTSCSGYQVAGALPLERKQWRFGVVPKGSPAGLLLIVRFTKPISSEAFLNHLSIFERSARYLANYLLSAVARNEIDPHRICPKPAAWDLPLEILKDWATPPESKRVE